MPLQDPPEFHDEFLPVRFRPEPGPVRAPTPTPSPQPSPLKPHDQSARGKKKKRKPKAPLRQLAPSTENNSFDELLNECFDPDEDIPERRKKCDQLFARYRQVFKEANAQGRAGMINEFEKGFAQNEHKAVDAFDEYVLKNHKDLLSEWKNIQNKNPQPPLRQAAPSPESGPIDDKDFVQQINELADRVKGADNSVDLKNNFDQMCEKLMQGFKRCDAEYRKDMINKMEKSITNLEKDRGNHPLIDDGPFYEYMIKKYKDLLSEWQNIQNKNPNAEPGKDPEANEKNGGSDDDKKLGDKGDDDGNNLVMIIAIAGGGGALLIIVIIIVACCCCGKKSTTATTAATTTIPATPITTTAAASVPPATAPRQYQPIPQVQQAVSQQPPAHSRNILPATVDPPVYNQNAAQTNNAFSWIKI